MLDLSNLKVYLFRWEANEYRLGHLFLGKKFLTQGFAFFFDTFHGIRCKECERRGTLPSTIFLPKEIVNNFFLLKKIQLLKREKIYESGY
jgi:hypothetical protein